MKNFPAPKLFITILLAVLSAWTILSIVGIGFLGIKSGSLAEMGQFGDMFGVLNSLFSALAFAGAAYAVCLQSRDLKEQDERHRDEKDREQKFFLRIKFEEIVHDLDAASRSIIQLRDSIGVEYLGNKKEVHALQRVIDDAFSKTRTLARLYFPGLVIDQHQIRELQQESLEHARKFCCGGLAETEMKQFLFNFAVKITGARSHAISLVDRYIANPAVSIL